MTPSGTGALNTNLNTPPYYDDFVSNNDYYMTLYKPGVAVQARELNAQQSVMYDQFKKFGDNVFVAGTIISGCNMSFHNNLNYVKLQDNYANGFPLTIGALNGFTALSTSGLNAYIFQSQQGFVVNSPNLNTIFVKYLNSATNTAIKTFQPDEVLTVFNASNVAIGNITVANAISSGVSNTTGLGYAMSVDNGVVYQKGMFLNVDKQTLIINAYSNYVDGVSVGFSSIEKIITSFQDQSLLDNSQGIPNRAAPGADRLQITPQLTAIQTNAISSNSFFSIADFVGGAPSIVNQDTEFAAIGAKIAQVSSETNGNFVINPFNIRLLQMLLANGSVDGLNIKLEVDRGLAYIGGDRVQVTGKLTTPISRAVTTGQVNGAIFSTTYGSYVIAQDMAGVFDPTIIQTVSLQSANAYGSSNNITKGVIANAITPPGTAIGNASLVMMKYNSGVPDTLSGQYFMYLFNIQMNGANSFSNVCSLYANNGGQIGTADIVQGTSNSTSLFSTNSALLIYPINTTAVNTLKNSANSIDASYSYKTSLGVTFPTGANVTINIPTHTGGTNILPYAIGPVTSTQLNAFRVIATGNAHSTNVAGTFVASSGSNTVTGPTTSLYVGALISVANASVTQFCEVASITNSTSFTITRAATATVAAGNAFFSYINGQVLPLSAMNANVNVINSSAYTINLNQTLNVTMTANVFYDVKRTNAVPRNKDLNTSVWACIDCANNAGGTTGPWCLGAPDIYAINQVYVGTTFSTSNPTSNNWTFDNGQSDIVYGLGFLHNDGMALTSSSMLLVNYSCFTSDTSVGEGFFSVDSYPVSNGTANSIFVQDIPAYYSTKAQQTYDLRNCIDFRVYVANSIPFISNGTLAAVNNAIINPNSAVTYVTSNNTLPTPGGQFQTSYSYFMGRFDTVGLSNTGTILTLQGIPSLTPVPPGNITNGLTLGTVYIPPYPSMTPDIIDPNMRSTYPKTSVTFQNNKRYTMADIAFLDSEIQQLQYYASLSVLEASAKNLQLTNANGASLFQNGILADPMQDFSVANTADPAFNLAIDSLNLVGRPITNAVPVNFNYVVVANDNVTLSNDASLVTLDYTPTIGYISQPFVSNTRNASCDTLYTWTGTCNLGYEGTWCPDLDSNPLIIGNYPGFSNWTDLENPWSTAYGWWRETQFFQAQNQAILNLQNAGDVTSATNIATETQYLLQSNNVCYVDNNPIIQPFCQPNKIQFSCYGLKPNTEYFPYFDDALIAQYVVQTDEEFNLLNTFNLTSDERGSLFGYYWLPAGVFYTGTRNFQILDVGNLYTPGTTITSYCAKNYYGTNLAFLNLFGIPLDQSGAVQVGQLYTRPCQPALPSVTSPLVLVSPTAAANSPAPGYANSANAISLPSGTISTSAPIVTVVNEGIALPLIPLINGFHLPLPFGFGLLSPALQNSIVSGEILAGDALTALLEHRWIALGYSPFEASLIIQQDLNYDSQLRNAELVYATGVVAGIVNTPGVISNTGGGCGDQISQTFTILSSAVPSGVTSVYLTSIDLFFHTIDTVLGVTVDVRGCDSFGRPDFSVLPFGSRHLWPEEIAISVDATVKQTINYPAPILLQVGQSYSFVVTPDGFNPNYLLHSAVLQETDLRTNASIYAFAGGGNLFLASQGVVWNSYDQESLTYNVNIAMFNPLSGTVAFQNDDSEYFQTNGNIGIMGPGDQAFIANNNNLIAGVTSCSNTSTTIMVGNTTGLVGITVANNNFVNGSLVMLLSQDTQLGFVTAVYNVINSTAFRGVIPYDATIQSGNSTFIAATNAPFTDNSSLTAYNVTNTPKGLIATVNNTFLVVNTVSSNATSFLTNTGPYIVFDGYAGGWTNSASLVDIPYDTFMPKFTTSIPNFCTINMAMSGVSNGSTGYVSDTSFTNITEGVDSSFYDEERVVMSKSNEISQINGAKSLTIGSSMSTTSSWESPAFDLIKSGGILIENVINAEQPGNTVFLSEINNSGNAINKYISTTVPLASGLSASDLQVYVSAFKPANTEIYVYAKLLNQYDSTSFLNSFWTPMYCLNTAVSTPGNLTDFNEYLYTFANTAPANTIPMAYTGYLNASNNNILTYTNPLNQVFTTFNQFAIKIVLLADSSEQVPMISDYRALAVT
jgi:hypothetical protein